MKRRFVDEDLKQKMRDLESQGVTRAEIAEQLDLDPSTVTKHLGPVRQYKHFRVQIA